MTDKNYREIKDGDKLRIKFYDSLNNLSVHGIYRVFLNGWDGATLHIYELIYPEMTLRTTIMMKRREITTRFVESQRCHQMYIESYGEITCDIEIVETYL